MDARVKDLIKWYKEYILDREIYFNFLKEDNTFVNSVLKSTRSILTSHNTTFQFERKGNNREGALTQKRTNTFIDGREILTKVIKIRKDINFENQVHTYFHELGHLVNNHNDQYGVILSTPQKEYVAEVISQSLLYSFCGGKNIEDISSNEKWNQNNYIEAWIKNAKMSDIKIKEMHNQIQNGYNIISDVIINYYKKTN